MLASEPLPVSPLERLEMALDDAWRIVKGKFDGGRIRVTKEAPLQHHYAQTLKALGNLYVTRRDEFWIVDLERKEIDLTREGHPDYVDVVCEVRSEEEDPIKSAVEMKFKAGPRGSPRASVQALVDIYRLERARESGYEAARFLMATDNQYCWMEPESSVVRSNFGIYEGREISAGEEIKSEKTTSKNILAKKLNKDRIKFKNSYLFEWEELGDFQSLGVKV